VSQDRGGIDVDILKVTSNHQPLFGKKYDFKIGRELREEIIR